MKRRNILLVNDDGIEAEGLRVLAEHAGRFGDVWVVAPEAQCSAMSHRITIFDTLRIQRRDFPAAVRGAWSVSGTPADCVKAAVCGLLPIAPDLLFSGINNGFNAGFDIAYSGTVAAAMEGLMKGIPSFAFSNSYNASFALIDRELSPLIERLLALPAERAAIWNVNFPDCAPEACRGTLWDRRPAATQLYLDNYALEEQEDGSLSMRNHAFPMSPELAPEGSDAHAVLTGHISVGKVFCRVL